ncbi:MAG: hypothetical protein ACRENG_25380 [bacterium]
MRTLQTYLFVALFLLGVFLIPGCRETERPAAPEGTSPSASQPSLQKLDDAEDVDNDAEDDDNDAEDGNDDAEDDG